MVDQVMWWEVGMMAEVVMLRSGNGGGCGDGNWGGGKSMKNGQGNGAMLVVQVIRRW